MGAAENQVCALAVQVVAFLRARVPGETDDDLVEVWLRRDEKSPSRRRGEPKYLIEIGFSWAPDMGLVLLTDGRGYGKRFSYRAAAEWVGKSLHGRAVHLAIHVQDASSVPPAWTKKRMDSLEKAVQDLDLPGLIQAAQDKRATVTQWVDSQRKSDVLAAAQVVEWCAYFARATAPGGTLGQDRQDGPAGGTPGGAVVPPDGGAGLPGGWSFLEDVGVYVWDNGGEPGTLAQKRAFSWLRPDAAWLRASGAPLEEFFVGVGYVSDDAGQADVVRENCVAGLWPQQVAPEPVRVMELDDVPGGPRLGLLLAALRVRIGDGMYFSLAADGQAYGQANFNEQAQESPDGMMVFGEAWFDGGS